MNKITGTGAICCLLLSACAEVGEPLSMGQVTSTFSGATVTTVSSDSRQMRKDFSNPSLGERAIYHAPDGRAYYTKQTDEGYRAREAGRWWARDNQICYSMVVTQAENNDSRCSSANVSVAYSEFTPGDVMGLAPRRRAPSASGSSTGGASVYSALAVLGGLALGAAVVSSALCGENCDTSGGSGGTSSSSGSSSSSKKAGSSSTATAKAASGYKITERIAYGPGQTVVARGRCGNGRSFNVRYYPDQNASRDHSIYSLFRGSVDEVARDYCK